MAESEGEIKAIQDEGDDLTPGYKAPAKIDLKTLTEKDADDEALVRYKQQLLAGAADAADAGTFAFLRAHLGVLEIVLVFMPTTCLVLFFVGADTGGPNVVVTQLALVVEGRSDVELDLTGRVCLHN